MNTSSATGESIIVSEMRQLDMIHQDAAEMFRSIPDFHKIKDKKELAAAGLSLDKQWIKNYKVCSIIDNIAVTVGSHPVQSYQEFCNNLPSIDIEGGTPKDPILNFVIRLDREKAFDTNNRDHRFMFNIYFSQVSAIFLERLMLSVNMRNKEKIDDLVKNVWDTLENFTEQTQNNNFDHVIMKLADMYSNAMSLISMYDEHAVCSVMQDQVSSILPKTTSPLRRAVFFLLFSKITFTKNNDLVDVLLNIGTDVIEKSSNDSIFMYPAFEWFANMAGNTLRNDEGLRKTKDIFQMSEIAKKFQTGKTSHPAELARAQVYVFSSYKEKLKQTMPEYVSKYVTDKPKLINEANAKIQLRVLTAILRGKNYQPEYILGLTHENIKFSDYNTGKEIAGKAFNAIISHAKCFGDAQKELCDCLFQIAITEFSIFVSKRTQDIISNEFLSYNSIAVFSLFHKIISPAIGFIDATSLGKYSKTVSDIVKKVVEGISASNLSTVWEADTFTDSLALVKAWKNISVSENVDDKETALVLESFVETSKARTESISKESLFKNSFQNVLNDYMCKFVKQSAFKALDNTIPKSENVPEFVLTKELLSISIIPLLINSQDFIKVLTNLIFGKDCHIAAFALRALQAIVYKQPERGEDALSGICKYVPNSYEGLLVQIQAVDAFVLTLRKVNATINDEVKQAIFTLILTGICAPSPTIRIKALALSSNASYIERGNNANFGTFVDDHQANIDTLVSRKLVSMGSYKQNDLTSISEKDISFYIRFKGDTFYTVFLSVLGKELIESDYKPYVERAIPGIMTVSKNIGAKVPLFILNMYIFVAATATEETAANVITNFNDAVSVLDNVAKDEVVPYLSYYISQIPTLRVTVLDNVEIKSSLMAHVVSYALRDLIENFDGYSDFVIKKLGEVTDYIIKSGAVEDDLEFSVNGDLLKKDQHIAFSICNVACCIRVYSEKLYNTSITELHGPYPRSDSFGGKYITGKNFDTIFNILVNSVTFNDHSLPEVKITTKETLVSFSRVYEIPDDMFSRLQCSLDIIAENSFAVLVAVLNSAYSTMLSYYIDKSISNDIFFRAIAAQFMEIKSFDAALEKWKINATAPMTEKEIDFATQTKAFCGQLIAISFLMLTSSDLTLRNDGLKTLINISLFTSMIENPKGSEYIEPLVRDLIDYKKDIILPSEKMETVLLSISENIANDLKRYQEPALKQAFKIFLEKPENTLYISVMSKWVNDIEFNREEAGISDLTDPENVSFTGFSLIKKFIFECVSLPLSQGHYRFLDAFMKQKSHNIETIEFIILTCYSIQQSVEEKGQNDEITERLVECLAYIFSNHPLVLVKHITQFFSFKAWFFYQIQLLKLFNNVDDDDSGDPNSYDIDLYEVSIIFTSKIIIKLLKDKLENMMPMIHYIIIFCILNYNDFDDYPKNILSDIQEALLTKNGDIEAIKTMITTSKRYLIEKTPALFSKNIRKLEKHEFLALQIIYGLPEKQIAEFAEEALKWGSTCGDISVSHKALLLYSLTATKCNKDTINLIINTLYSLSSVLHEVTAKGWQPAKYMAININETNTKVDNSKEYEYISGLIDVLHELVASQEYPDANAFKMVIQYFNCRNADKCNQQTAELNILESALDFTSSVISNPLFVEEFTTDRDHIAGLLQAQHTEQSLKKTISFFCKVALTNSFKCITTMPTDVIFLSILPFAYLYRNDKDVFPVIDAFKRHITNSSALEIYSDFFEKCNAKIAEKFIQCFSDRTSGDCLLNVVYFYESIVAFDDNAATYAYYYLKFILLSKQSPLTPDKFGVIANKAALRKDNNIVNLRSVEFLEILKKKGGQVTKKQLSSSVKRFPEVFLPFPSKPFKSSDEVDPFASISTLPPFLIFNPKYTWCNFNEPYHEIVQQVKVAPFTNWNETMFKAEAITIQDNMNLNPDQVTLGDVSEFFKLFEKALTNQQKKEGASTAVTSSDAGNAKLSFDDYENETINIDYNVFLPDKNEVKNIGSNYLNEFELPDF